MSDKNNNYIEEIIQLVMLTFDGKISEEQFEYLDKQLKSNSKARECYLKMLTIYTALSDYSNSGIVLDKHGDAEGQNESEKTDLELSGLDGKIDINVILKLAKDELSAPGIELPKPVQPEPISQIDNLTSNKEVKKESKLYYFAFAAAIAIVFGFIFFTPQPGYETATLVSTLDAQWENSPLENGHRFIVGDDSFYQLNDGFAEILFDNKTLVTIEAPTEFQVINDSKLAIKQGRLYANVPKAAIGFTVKTPNSTIVDLGTEFGIESYSSRVSELYVMKGKVALGSGSESSDSAVTLEEGAARMVIGSEGEISELPYEPHKFARKIDVRDNFIWRGESLKLTDFISGSNGFSDVKKLEGIDYKSGRLIDNIRQRGITTDSKYHSVGYTKYIDGIFVPDGGNGDVTITSAGHTFQCPDTSGLYTHETTVYRGGMERQHDTIPQLILNGVEYSNSNILVLHSNGGITFDLDAIRDSANGMRLTGFKTFGGITEAKFGFQQIPGVDFWVLVDGEIRYEIESLKIETGMIDLDISLSDQDRFLTFIVTDGLESLPEDYKFPAVGNDFLHFVDPVITIEPMVGR